TEQRYTLAPLRVETTPGKPHIEVEATGVACQCSNDVRVDRYRMRLDLLPECLAQTDHVCTRIRSVGMVFRFRIAPETEAIEEVESAIIPYRLRTFSSFICSEEHRAGKDPFKAVYQTPVVRTIFRQI